MYTAVRCLGIAPCIALLLPEFRRQLNLYVRGRDPITTTRALIPDDVGCVSADTSLASPSHTGNRRVQDKVPFLMCLPQTAPPPSVQGHPTLRDALSHAPHPLLEIVVNTTQQITPFLHSTPRPSQVYRPPPPALQSAQPMPSHCPPHGRGRLQ